MFLVYQMLLKVCVHVYTYMLFMYACMYAVCVYNKVYKSSVKCSEILSYMYEATAHVKM